MGLDTSRLALARARRPRSLRHPAQFPGRFPLLARALILAMYKILGGDQKQYGPVSTDEVRAWIAEGRLNAASLAWTEGAPDWKPLASFPEFADALRAKAVLQPPPGAPLPPGMAEAYQVELLARPTRVQIGSCMSRSWTLLAQNFGLLFGTTAIVWAISFGCNLIPWIGGLAYWLLRGVLYGGMYLVFLKRIRREEVNISTLFSGFQIAFVQLFLAGVVSGLLSSIATACCLVIPGVYLLVAWIFSLPLVADKRLEFWSAMELSRKVVTRVFFQIFGLLVLTALPMLATLFFLGIKIAIAITPIIQKAVASGQPDPAMLKAAIENLVMSSVWVMILMNLVFVLNYPFIIGALMYAYEDLFGAGRAPSA